MISIILDPNGRHYLPGADQVLFGKNMKRILGPWILLPLAILLTENTSAQRTLPEDAFSVGVLAGEHGYDSGIGIEVGTPLILNTGFCFRIKGNISWLEDYKAAYDHWAKYRSVTGVLVYNTSILEGDRAYFELGTYLIIPNQKFSTSKSIQGFTASAGVELFLLAGSKLQTSYYFSGGIGYIKAYADKIESQPRYANGLIFSNGFRFYF